MATELEIMESRAKVWQDNPVKFVEEAIGVGICDCGCKIDWQQAVILNDVRDFIRSREKKARGEKLTSYEDELCKKFGISVKSGKGVGKTAVLSWALIYMNFCFGVSVKSMVTAPKADLLKDNLFGEISTWISHSKRVFGDNSILDKVLGVQSLKLYRKVGLLPAAITKECVTIGRTCSRSADEATLQGTLQGYHDNYQIFGADESFAVPDPVFIPVETTMTRAVNFMLLIGNPTRNSGYAYETFNKYSELWVNRTINAEHSSIVSSDHIAKMKIRYKDYPNMYRTMVLGEFPLDDEGALIPFSKIMEAVQRYEDLEDDDPRVNGHGVVLGCDIGCGGDLSVIISKQGIRREVIGSLNERDTQVTARWIEGMSDLHGADKIGIDGITWGKGTYDRVKEDGYSPKFIDARGKTSDKDLYANLRAELYIKLASKFISGDIAIPRHDQLIKELSILKKVEGGVKLQIISKKAMKKDGIDSPNYADSLMMCEFFSERSIKVAKEDTDAKDRYKDKLYSQNASGCGWQG